MKSRWSDILREAQRNGDKNIKTEALAEIANEQARSGDFRSALKTAQQIDKDDPRRDRTLEVIVACQSCGEFFKDALNTTNQIGDEAIRTGSLAGIAERQATTGDIRGARSTAEQIVRPPNNRRDLRDIVLTHIAETQAQNGDPAGAIQTAMTISSGTRRIDALRHLAETRD